MMGSWARFFCIFLLLATSHGKTHKCIHDEVFDKTKILAAPQRYTSKLATDTTPDKNPIRLIVDTSYLSNDLLGRTCTSTGQVVTAQASSTSSQTIQYTCTSSDVLTPDIRSYLLTLIGTAQTLWEETLLVVPVDGLLKLSGSTSPQGLYGGVYINGTYTSTGVTADMVIFVTARPILSTGSSTETLAVATVVQQDQSGRPICGNLNINVGGISTSSSMYPQNFGVVVHEMTHALGFNYDMFADLSITVNLNVAAGDQPSSRTIINSPKVVAWAQAYYGCSTMQGVELENQGGSGTALSHWEKRITNNEYMTGTASRNPVFSELTLSLLEDTGWYGVNYSQTGQMLWGQGMGCDFVLRSCPNWPDYQGYYCTNNGQTGCTSDYQAKGVCQISTASGIPATYQYFSDPTEIGSYDLPDYCPLTWGYDNGWCFDTTQGSSSLLNQGEVFGDSSRCFDSSLLKDLPVGGSTNQVCYQSACTGPQELRIMVGDYWYLCPPSSQIKVIGYGGEVSCPSQIQQVCANSAVDTTWPVFLTISPNAGGPGLTVTITGKNFLAGITVVIEDTLSDIVVVSSTTITAVIPDSNDFKNPANIIEQKKSVIITDTKGRTCVGYDSFTVKVSLNVEFFENALEYLASNWLITAALITAILVTCCVCGYCCYRQKGQAEEADVEEYYE